MAFTFSFSRVASLLSFLCRLGSNLLTTTSHCCGFEAHNNCTHCAFCFAHSVCVYEGGGGQVYGPYVFDGPKQFECQQKVTKIELTFPCRIVRALKRLEILELFGNGLELKLVF